MGYLLKLTGRQFEPFERYRHSLSVPSRDSIPLTQTLDSKDLKGQMRLSNWIDLVKFRQRIRPGYHHATDGDGQGQALLSLDWLAHPPNDCDTMLHHWVSSQCRYSAFSTLIYKYH